MLLEVVIAAAFGGSALFARPFARSVIRANRRMGIELGDFAYSLCVGLARVMGTLGFIFGVVMIMENW
jgi:hypothetical protein